MSKSMSQREAREWKLRALNAEAELDGQRASWAHNWPGGTCIATIDMASGHHWAVWTARKLRHAVVVVPVDDEPKARLFALPLPKVTP